MADVVFLIGPDGAGKSTVGKLLASRLGCAAIDLDDEFCDRILNIREFITLNGYERYLEENAKLLKTLLEEADACAVFILSSGFLATDIRPDIVEQNRKQVHRAGLSVLLLPSRDYHEALSCIVERQLKRGFGLKRESEVEKFRQRFEQYLPLGDVQIFSMAVPDAIADSIARQLATLRPEDPSPAHGKTSR
ncbi:shikimate kinase [Enterobacteriaceae bacterium RIT693]|nr:shikimate kinase [Enterobacteriaceae bacterium RIT693]